MSKKEKKKKDPARITKALAALDKRYGERVVMKMTDSDSSVETFSSGRAQLDAILGGGYGVGKIIEIYAEAACGKTGLALEAIKVIQDDGGIAAIIDAEHALNTEYCEQIGIDVDALWISQPSHGEQAFQAMRALISSAEVDLIVVDSVTSLVPKSVLEGETGEAKIAMLARMMSQGLAQITAAADAAGCTIIFINQMRSAVMSYGASTKTTGGKSLPFYATQRLEIKNRGKLKEGDEIIGFKQAIKITKNKIARPFLELQENIVYGVGVDAMTSLIEALLFEEILEKAGSWIRYDGTNVAQGSKKLRIALQDNPELLEELKAKLAEKNN